MIYLFSTWNICFVYMLFKKNDWIECLLIFHTFNTFPPHYITHFPFMYFCNYLLPNILCTTYTIYNKFMHYLLIGNCHFSGAWRCKSNFVVRIPCAALWETIFWVCNIHWSICFQSGTDNVCTQRSKDLELFWVTFHYRI